MHQDSHGAATGLEAELEGPRKRVHRAAPGRAERGVEHQGNEVIIHSQPLLHIVSNPPKPTGPNFADKPHFVFVFAAE